MTDTAFDLLVAMLRRNAAQAAWLAHEHRLIDGRCATCRSAGGGSDGRMMECRIGAAARRALEPQEKGSSDA